jgi:hypothetical protein
MKSKSFIFLAVIALMATTVWADQIVLKNGTVYSGQFVRGDAGIIEFKILGRIESFRISDIVQIEFKSSPESVKSEPAQIPPAAAVQQENPQPQTQAAPVTENNAGVVILPEGTPVTIRTATAIDTDNNKEGDLFDAILDEPLMQDNQVVVARGAAVKGRIVSAKESGKLAGRSQLMLELLELTVNGKVYPLHTSDYTEVGSSRGKRTATAVGGGAAIGAIIGAIAGGGKGAAIGAASGAALGTGVQVLTRGQTLKIPVETLIEFKLQSQLAIDAMKAK